MADWVICPHCRLRHTRRPDAVCPRCKGAIEDRPATAIAARASSATAAVAPPAMPDVFDERAFSRVREHEAGGARHAESLSFSARLAGAILLGNGIVQLVLRTVEPATDAATALAAPWTASFDVVVGAVLVTNQSQVLRWTRVRLILGGAVLALLQLAQIRLFDAVLQVPFCLSLLWLLGDSEKPWRLPACVGAATAAIMLALCSAAPFMGWPNPLGRMMGRLNGEIGGARAELVGAGVPFRMNLAPGRWHGVRLSREEREEVGSTRDENGARFEMTTAVRRPESMLDLRLFAIQAPPDASVDGQEVMETLVDNARDGLPELLVVEDEWHEGAGGVMRVLEGRARLEGQRAAVAVGLRVTGGCVFMLIGTAPVRIYDKVRDDLLEAYASLESSGC